MITQSIDPELRKQALRLLLINLQSQYTQRSFNIASAVDQAYKQIFTSKMCEENLLSKSQLKTIYNRLKIVADCVGRSPKIWVQLLQNDEISSETSKIVINSPQSLTLVYQRLLAQIQGQFQLIKNKEDGEKIEFSLDFMNQVNTHFFGQLLASVAQELCHTFKKSVQFIKQSITHVEQQIKKTQTMNSFLLFSLLKQQSILIQSHIHYKIIENMFRSFVDEDTRIFSQYFIKNYQRISLRVDYDLVPKILTKKEEKNFNEEYEKNWLQFIEDQKNITVKMLTNNQGERALLVIDHQKITEENSELKPGIILQVPAQGKVKVVSSETTQKAWYAIETDKAIQNIQDFFSIKGIDKIDQELISSVVPLDAYATVGGNIGKCLAGINNYKNANQFMKDLTKKTMVSGSAMYLIMEIPILGYFFLAGGFSYSLYQAFSNQATNNPKKFKKFTQDTATVFGTASTSIAGMLLGQALIPIPFFGAFVGGIVGGFLGQKGTRTINTLIEKDKFKKLIAFLKKTLKKVYWEYSGELLEYLEINMSYFDKKNPFRGYSRDYWATALCFQIVSLYESQRYAQHNKDKLDEKQKQTGKMQDEEIFQNQFDLVGITDYLTSKRLFLKEHITEIELTIGHLIKM